HWRAPAASSHNARPGRPVTDHADTPYPPDSPAGRPRSGPPRPPRLEPARRDPGSSRLHLPVCAPAPRRVRHIDPGAAQPRRRVVNRRDGHAELLGDLPRRQPTPIPLGDQFVPPARLVEPAAPTPFPPLRRRPAPHPHRPTAPRAGSPAAGTVPLPLGGVA